MMNVNNTTNPLFCNFITKRIGGVMPKIYQTPDTKKPHDISINAVSGTGVKLTTIENLDNSQFANSID